MAHIILPYAARFGDPAHSSLDAEGITPAMLREQQRPLSSVLTGRRLDTNHQLRGDMTLSYLHVRAFLPALALALALAPALATCTATVPAHMRLSARILAH
jgi:hypothetical protein